MTQTLDFVAPIAFLTTAFVITRLMSKIRKSVEDRNRAEETLRKSQTELAHFARVMTMGELAASIAHEINQPLAAIVNNGSACLRWLAGDAPNLEEAREATRGHNPRWKSCRRGHHPNSSALAENRDREVAAGH